jgi:hypothetical protein
MPIICLLGIRRKAQEALREARPEGLAPDVSTSMALNRQFINRTKRARPGMSTRNAGGLLMDHPFSSLSMMLSPAEGNARKRFYQLRITGLRIGGARSHKLACGD